MRISDFYIDGFGIFYEQGVQNIPGGLVLFTGKNECGKTTLMEFIRTILFGLPKKGNDYKPFRGGNHGGRLWVAMQDGRIFKVERLGRHSTVTEDGNPAEQVEPSERLLRSIDRQTFERIFAIGLKDMEGLDVLSDEGIRGRLLAASAGVGASSLPSIMGQIDGEMESLLKSRGKNPKINALVIQLEEANSEIRKLHSQSAKYAELQRNLAELEEQIQQEKPASESIRQRLARIEQLRQARESWAELCEARSKVKELEDAQRFPPNGMERLEKLKEEIENELEERKAWKSKIEEFDTQLGILLEDQDVRSKVIEYRTSIRTLVKEREKLNSALNDLPGVKGEIEQKERDFKRKLHDLGADWTLERLESTDTSVQTRHWVQEFGKKLDSAERHYEQLQADKRALENAEREAKNKVDEAQELFEKLTKLPIDNLELLRKKREAVWKMRSLFYQKATIGVQSYDKNQRLKEEKSRFEAVGKRLGEQTKPLPSWTPFVALIAGLALAAVSAIWKLYILIPVMALAGAVMMFWLRRQIAREISRIAQIQEEKQELEIAIKVLDKEIKELGTRIISKNDEIKQTTQDAGLDQPEDLKDLDRMEAGLEDAGEKLRDWIGKKQKIDEAEKNWLKAQKQSKEAEQAVRKAYEELQQLKDEWQKWIAERGFAEIVRPEGFEVILQMVENIRTSNNTLNESRQRVSQIEFYIEGIRIRIKKALEICNMKPSVDIVGVGELDVIDQALSDALEIKQKKESLEQQLVEARKDMKQIDERIKRKRSEKDDLLQQAGASDEEDFRRKAKDYNEWSEYTKQIEASNRALLAIAGTIEAQENLEKELAETESHKLNLEADNLQDQLSNKNGQVSEAERRFGRISVELDQMAHDERLSELLLKQHALKEELSDAVRQWATLAITRYLLDQARSIYERERQPKVIQEATRFVEIMTDRPYRLVMPAEDSRNIQLEDRTTLNRKSEIGWSSGLADQVYLAIRFGLAKDFAQHEEPLPIILDDVLVRFDPYRQLGAANVILDLSRYHQVLMFTCHPSVREITEKALESCNFRDDIKVAYYTINDGIIKEE